METDDFFWNVALENDNTHRSKSGESEPTPLGDDSAIVLAVLAKEIEESVPLKRTSVQILENRGKGVWDVIGGEVWEASLLLSEYLRQMFAHSAEPLSSVMEVGCGVALPSLFLSEILSEEKNYIWFTLTDYNIDLIHLIRSNLLSNFTRSIIELPLFTRMEPIAKHQVFQLAKLDWTVFTPAMKWDNLDSMLSSSLNRFAFDVLYGSALCYASCHACLAYMIQYYLSGGRCREVIVVQIRDRAGFQEVVGILSDLGVPSTLEEVSPEVYDRAAQISMVQSGAKPRTGDTTLTRDDSDDIQLCTEYHFPTEILSAPPNTTSLLRTERSAFTVLRAFPPKDLHKR